MSQPATCVSSVSLFILFSVPHLLCIFFMEVEIQPRTLEKMVKSTVCTIYWSCRQCQ
ncbi:hypothetical protein B0H12DRAFT_1154188 [Mycena haematopus]|nr:hypothetical protein B0H12DRAFT_1154188 [Mycena haematopus]